jgi:chromosome partitioning protein
VPTITILNQKGGVGKTSACHHLSGTLAKLGRHVLLVDNDPQASLTQGFWGPAASKALDPGETIAAIYRGDHPYPEQVIRPTGIEGIDLVPGSRAATRYNVPEPQEADPQLQTLLRDFLVEAHGAYDLVLIDCPPNLHLASWSALTASDHLIVPLQPEDYGAQGLSDVLDSLDMVRATTNPGLNLLGYLLTMVSRKSIHQVYEARLRALYGPAVFDARIPEAVDYAEAIARRQPVGVYKPRSAAALAIRALVDELLARLESWGAARAEEAA